MQLTFPNHLVILLKYYEMLMWLCGQVPKCQGDYASVL